jgi:HlyD family secretion protein
MKRVITVIIVLVIIGGGGYAFMQYRAGQQAAAASDYQTVTAQQGDLTATVGATGSVHSSQSAVLTWQTSGTVDQVNVEVGNAVTKDQELTNLVPTSLPQNVILAQADLVNAQQALKDLYDTELALAQAEDNLSQAQKAVDDAQQYLDNLNSDAPQVDIDQAESNVVLLKDKLTKAQKNFKPYANKPEDNVVRARLQNQLAEAQRNYDNAVTLLNNLKGQANETTYSIAESNLTLAKAQLADAQKKYDDLKSGPAADDVTNAKTRVQAAQATIKLASITAPFAGSVTEVNIKPGDQVSAGAPAFRLDDLSQLLVDVQVSEVDINRIQVGQDVTLSFDAILGKQYKGKVSEVSLVGTSNQGVVDFTVTVELMDADDAVKPGMTAAVNIVVEQLKNVLLVPNRAVRVLESNRVVYVLRNGALEPLTITLGASSDTNSEVVSGDLKVGDQIVLNPPVVFDQSGPPPFVQR